ncbi:MAG TPA: hypothetical protein VHM88_25540 [Candidatus Acidoferrales bacterium]|jgi:hypothetical protein|nr:hypothetical protein [Candidatus Acidoferrales bacterium]
MTAPKSQVVPGPQVVPGAERRRSQRVMIRVPVILTIEVAREAVTIRAETVEVNDHGAMLLCSRALTADSKFQLENDRTRQHLICRVVRAPQESREGFLIPAEFEAPVPGFWQISFPPTDWKPLDD